MNPSFEHRKEERCLVFLGDFVNSVLDWSKPNNGSTDSFHICSPVMGKNNYNGQQSPEEGEAYCGIYTFSPYSNYREYIQGELKTPLTAGKTYKVSMYISLADKATHAIKGFQVLFTEKKLKGCFDKNNCEKVIVPKKATNKKFVLHTFESDGFLERRDTWQELSFEFVASGFETFFSIGNFKKDNNTELKEVLTVSKKENKFSYYYIDNVSVEPLTKGEQKQDVSEPDTTNLQFESDKIYIFKNVLFNFDKSELLDISKEELQKLYLHLNYNKNLSVEIYGHTDNVGTDERNEELSKERAKAVSDYLINQGITSERIKWFGFGSSKPITSNETEEGRTQNRRVEYKLISE